jgi:5-methylcytosine-specific restriction enzyme subunit McrC
MRWDAASDTEQLKMLAVMRTYIHLQYKDQRTIIDTKYYVEALQEHHGKSSIRSENLYQLFSYSKNAEAIGPEYRNAEGVLLYPAVGEKLSFRAEMQGHQVRVFTINLDQPWQLIRSDFLSLVYQNRRHFNGQEQSGSSSPASLGSSVRVFRTLQTSKDLRSVWYQRPCFD